MIFLIQTTSRTLEIGPGLALILTTFLGGIITVATTVLNNKLVTIKSTAEATHMIVNSAASKLKEANDAIQLAQQKRVDELHELVNSLVKENAETKAAAQALATVTAAAGQRTQGAQGVQGEQGPQGIQGKTG